MIERHRDLLRQFKRLMYQLEYEAKVHLKSRRKVYINRGRRALIISARMAGTATADDVQAAVTLPSNIDPVCLAAVPGPLARAGIIGRTGIARSSRYEGHGRSVTVWELTDCPAAYRWLAAHPDGPDPGPAWWEHQWGSCSTITQQETPTG